MLRQNKLNNNQPPQRNSGGFPVSRSIFRIKNVSGASITPRFNPVLRYYVFCVYTCGKSKKNRTPLNMSICQTQIDKPWGKEANHDDVWQGGPRGARILHGTGKNQATQHCKYIGNEFCSKFRTGRSPVFPVAQPQLRHCNFSIFWLGSLHARTKKGFMGGRRFSSTEGRFQAGKKIQTKT